MLSKRTDLILKLILVILVLIFITTILIKRFIYFMPTQNFLDTQEKYIEIKLRHLYGWLLENSNNAKIIIYFPNNSDNISYRQNKIRMLHNIGYNVLIFDYSGFGRSSGIPNEQQLYDDACSIVSMALQKYNKHQITLYGEQIGAPIATYAARRYNILSLILESPLPNIKYIFNHKIRKYFGIFFNEFSTELYLNGYNGRTLILHMSDTTINNLLSLCTDEIVFTHETELPLEKIKQFIEHTYSENTQKIN